MDEITMLRLKSADTELPEYLITVWDEEDKDSREVRCQARNSEHAIEMVSDFCEVWCPEIRIVSCEVLN